MSGDDFLKELQDIFLVEAKDLVEQNESNFLELESNPGDQKIIEKIFRVVHNIKGSGKSVGYDKLSEFCHHFENLLVKIKNGELTITSDITDILLRCNDRLAEFVTSLQDSGIFTGDVSDLEDEIERVLREGNIAKPVEMPQDIDDLLNNPELIQKLESIPPTVPEIPKEEVKVEKPAMVEKKIEQKKTDEILPSENEQNKRGGASTDDYVKISLSKIDNLLNYFGEQVILQSTLEFAKKDINAHKDLIIKTIGQLSKITYDLQQNAISLRMFGLKGVFTKMERIVRDASKSLGKKINFVKVGENNELDKTIIDLIVDPLTHMIRNSVDHGVETPRERVQKGKPEEGTIRMETTQKSGFFYIVIKDDGKGIDKEKVVEKAIKSGIIKTSEGMTENQIFQLIFHSGLSTKDQATEISGRGVGMDVVKEAITKLKGQLEVESKLNEGTVFTIKLPLTLAIFNGIVVELGKQRYIFPNSDVEETITIDPKFVRTLGNRQIVKVKEEVVPIIDLETMFSKNVKIKDEKEISGSKKNDQKMALIVNNGKGRFALVVGDLLAQQRIVQKTVGSEIKKIPAISGGTILGDGKVALILETNKIVDLFTKAA